MLGLLLSGIHFQARQGLPTNDVRGLKLLADPLEAIVEQVPSLPFLICMSLLKAFSVVAVHGMDGDWKGSWLHESSGTFWLKDLLPPDLPHARIFSYSYDSRTRSLGPPLTLDISDYAKDLILDLELERALTNVIPWYSYCVTESYDHVY